MKIAEILHPFAAIAQELRILRELYELELSSRNPPIIRVTESPGPNDTMVSYVGTPESAKAIKAQEILEEWSEEDEWSRKPRV